jgi:DNA topoisomerase-3
VIGKAADVAFKTTGKVILQKDGALFLKIPTQRKKKQIYYRLYQRRKGPHQLVLEKETKAPNQFTATLLGPWKPQENRWTMKIYAN